jgi:competence protein ComEC
MVLGRRAGLDRRVERAFVDSGCAHYLAVSGFHVGMLAFFIALPARLLGFGKRKVAAMVLVAVVAYALLVDARPPIARAGLMAGLYACAVMLRRPRAVMSAVSLAAIILLVVDPRMLFDVGFQLSFATVIGIVGLQPGIMRGLSRVKEWGRRVALREKPVSAKIERIAQQHRPKTRFDALVRVALAGLAVALAAWLAALPIVAAGFGRVPVWGWFISWLAFPLVFVVMGLGFLRMACGVVLPPLAFAIDIALRVAVDGLLALLAGMSHLPYANIAVPPPTWWLVIAYYAVLVAFAVHVRASIPKVLTGVVAGFVLMWCVSPGWSVAPFAGVRITQLAVGRGTATVVELPDGGVWLYDAGASGNYDPGKGTILPYLYHRGVRHIDGVVISHANLDHFGGLPSVMAALPCGPVYVSRLFEASCADDAPCRVFLDLLAERGHAIEVIDRGTVIKLAEGVTFETLWPPADAPLGMDTNDTSLVQRLCLDEQCILFTGDIGYAAQQWLIDHADIAADVLVLPHHGAVEGNTGAFLERVGASVLVRSTFVRASDSDRLYEVTGDRTVYSTADAGAIEILLDGSEIRVAGYRETP